MGSVDARAFIRHPGAVPIEVEADGAGPIPALHMENVSRGGLCFCSPVPLEVGSVVRLRIPHVRPPFETDARVAWSRPSGDEHDVGVRFLTASDAFRARMVEQVCHIEAYRQRVRHEEGREIDGAQAAREWIERYAEDFPGPPPAE